MLSSWTSSVAFTLKPMIIASSGLISKFAFAEIKSDLFIGPIPVFTIWMFSCLRRVISASRLPSESALMIIPCLSVLIVWAISFLKDSFICSKLLDIFWKGIPVRIPSLLVSCNLRPVAAVDSFVFL